jgi:phosphatidylinositol glycan class A protein
MVVTTDVGGVPEVLPKHMAFLAKPDINALHKQLVKAIKVVKKTDTSGYYAECKSIYSWR